MKLPPVRASRLHGTKLHGSHDRRVSIFPFFNAEGEVFSHMVTDKGAGKVLFVPHSETLVVIPLAGRLRMDGLRALDEEAVSSVSGLWHYDPWWVLAEPPFSEHWATPALKQTNCVDYLEKDISSLSFSRDLSAVASATFDEPANVEIADRSGKTPESKDWSSRFLSQPTSGPDRADGSGRPPEWVLDPIWKDPTE